MRQNEKAAPFPQSLNEGDRTPDWFRLDGRVVVVTGGAGLLGMEFAAAVADLGARVALLDLDAETCRTRAHSLHSRSGTECIGIHCDVADRASWDAAVDAVVRHLGAIDVLINGAAYTTSSPSSDYGAAAEGFPLKDWDAILDVNLTGTFLGCQAVGAHMLERGTGSIINLASLYALVSPHHPIYEDSPIRQPVAYSVSKAGVLALTRYLGTLWARRGVRVNALTPGGVFADHGGSFLEGYERQSPSGRMADRREMRGAVAFLASDASSYCVGQNLVVDGGWTAW